MIEIRWHGRGGQGVVSISEILAKAAIYEGLYAQHFPEFGPERRGAPVRAYTRIDNKEIDLHCGVYNPDYIIVLDPTLLELKEWISLGEKKDTIYIINSKTIPEFLKNKKVYNIDAVTITQEIFGKPYYNIVMLGALIKILNNITIDSVIKILEERWKGDLLDKNLRALKAGYNII